MSTRRDLLRVDKLGGFKTFLTAHGWDVKERGVQYEALYATHTAWPVPMVVYRKGAGDIQHLTVHGIAVAWVFAFLELNRSNRRIKEQKLFELQAQDAIKYRP